MEILNVVVILSICNIEIQILELGTKVQQEGLKKIRTLQRRREKDKLPAPPALGITAPGATTSISV